MPSPILNNSGLSVQRDNENGLLRLWQVLEILPVSKSTFYQRIREGDFPAPIKNGGCSFWRISDIATLIRRISGGK